MSKDKDTQLTIVDEDTTPFEGMNITQHDIDNLNVEKLKDGLLKGMYVLEAGLYGQASLDFQRINKINKLLKKIEEIVLAEDVLKGLDANQQLRLYRALSENQKLSLRFLQDLHNGTASALQVIDQIEKHKDQGKTLEQKDFTTDKAVGQVKAMIMAEIAKKTKKNKGKKK